MTLTFRRTVIALLIVAVAPALAACAPGPASSERLVTAPVAENEHEDEPGVVDVVTAPTPPVTTTTTTPTPPNPGSLGQLGPPSGSLVNASVNPSCGTEQWAIKTLQDQGSGGVDSTPVVIGGVSQLNAVAPANAGQATRGGIELHAYQLTGTLVAAKLEADSDLHVILKDASGQTVVTEYPASGCIGGAAPAAQADMNAARAAFVASCGQPPSSSFKSLTGTATVVGVGFYDFDHGQAFKDPLSNGFDIELHPILRFTGGCQ